MPTRSLPVHERASDEALYPLARGGDLRAFDVLYRRYEGRLFGFLLRMVRHRQDAEDLFHETFLCVLRSREVTFDQATFATWLFRVARNQALNHLRSARRKLAAGASLASELTADGLTGDPLATPAAALDLQLAQRQGDADLQRALTQLPPGLLDVYRLRTAGMSYEQMATALDIPIGTVKSRMNQMTQRLQAHLQTAHDRWGEEKE